MTRPRKPHPPKGAPPAPPRPGVTLGLDGRTLALPGSADRGIGHYTAHHLEALALARPDWTFLLFQPESPARTWALDRLLALPNVEARPFRDLARTPMDLFHIPDLMGLPPNLPVPWTGLPARVPRSVVFYDLIPLVLRQSFLDLWPPAARKTYLARLDALKHSKALVLTISQHTKRDLAEHLGLEEGRMVPIMAGLNQSEAAEAPSPDRIEAVLQAQGLAQPFFLVVGALDPHKRFSTTLAAFAEVLKTREAHLAVVGSLSNPITQAYKTHFEERGIQRIRFTGFLSREDLECLYRAATALVFPSAYEGFGLPVLEAMAQGCPVITSRASSLPEVAGDAALLVSPDDPSETAEAMRRLIEEPALRDTLVARGHRQVARFSWAATAEATLEAWAPLLGRGPATAPTAEPGAPAPARTSVRWEGTQFVWHSLAHVNRQLCLGLLRDPALDLSLVPYEADQFRPQDHPAFAPLAERVGRRPEGPVAVHVRHQWPPRFTPPAEGCWVLIQPWEYGGLPQAWVEPMSTAVDEIWVYTTWLRDRYLESGVPADRVAVVPLGVDTARFHPEGPRFPLAIPKAFRFLFVGGLIPRKGVDVLLAAYRRAFTAADDVCLVIKAQGGGVYAGSELHEALRDLQADPAAPALEVLSQDLGEAELAALYRSCHAFVMPYRGEGFGLPIAEAMASGLPVVVPGRGAAMDFTQGDWALRIPSRPFPLPRVDTFLPGPAGFWLEEPDEGALVEALVHLAAHPDEARDLGARARAHAETHLGWDRAVRLASERLRALAGRRPRRLQAPAAPPPPPATALVCTPDWTGAEWAEVVLSHLTAFAPGDPVALVLALDGRGPAPAEAEGRVVDLARGTGRAAFPDILLVGPEDDLEAALRPYLIRETIPAGRGAVQGLRSLAGLRFAQARMQLTRS